MIINLSKVKIFFLALRYFFINKEIRNNVFLSLKSDGFKATLLKTKMFLNSNRLNIQHNIKSTYSNSSEYLSKDLLSLLSKNKEVIVLFSHNLTQSGAPLLLLNIAKQLSNDYSLIIITLMGGDLYEEFSRYCYIISLNQTQLGYIENNELLEHIFFEIYDMSINQAILNTLAGGFAIPLLEKYNFKYQILVHELPHMISKMGWETSIIPLLSQIKNGGLIYSSNFVANIHKNTYKLRCDINIKPQGCFQVYEPFDKIAAKSKLCKYLNVAENSKIVIGAGKGFFRKGIDLFYEIYSKLFNEERNYVFVFLTDMNDPSVINFIASRLDKLQNFLIIDFNDDYKLFLQGADVFALTSREDPLPNVLIDAMAFGLPTIAFDGCGGAPELLSQINEFLIAKKLDITDFSKKIQKLIDSEQLVDEIRNKSIELISTQYNFKHYVNQIISLIENQYFKPYLLKNNSKPNVSYKRVLHIIANFNIGGSSQLVVDLIEGLEEYQHFVITQFIPHPQKYLGINILQIDLNNIDDLNGILSSINPNLVHVHYWGRDDLTWYRSIYSILEKFPYPVIQNINVPVKPFIHHTNSKYVYVSEFVRNNFGNTASSNELVIYPGSDFTTFVARELKDDYPYHYVGMVYRLSVDKINEASIMPFIELAKINANIKCLIVGDGLLLPVYKKLVSDHNLEERFIFTGYVSYADLPKLYAQMAMFIAPVFDESFGQVTPFAMNVGMPVVAYDTGAMKEILNLDSLIVKPGDSLGLANMANAILNDKKKMLEIAKNNQLRAKEKFSLEKMIDSYRKLYKREVLLRNPKILVVASNTGAQEGGGADAFWPELCLKMIANEFEVALNVWAPYNMPETVKNLSEKNVNVSYCSETGTNILAKFSPNLVIIIQGDSSEGGHWFKECYTKKIPYAIVNQLSKEGFWPDDTLALSIRNGYLNANQVFFTCENNRLLLERQIGAKVKNANRHYNPVKGIPYNIVMPFPDIRESFYLACPARMIIIHKGQDLLFEVMRQDKWKKRNLIINLYGDGPHKQQLEQLKVYYDIRNIIFCKYQKDVKSIWLKNHGIILPSRMEGIPIVLLGAMLCGRVPILTNVGGHSEIINDNESGFIAAFPSADALDEALERAWQMRHDWQKIGQNARHAITNFMPEQPIEDFIHKLGLCY